MCSVFEIKLSHLQGKLMEKGFLWVKGWGPLRIYIHTVLSGHLSWSLVSLLSRASTFRLLPTAFMSSATRPYIKKTKLLVTFLIFAQVWDISDQKLHATFPVYFQSTALWTFFCKGPYKYFSHCSPHTVSVTPPSSFITTL